MEVDLSLTETYDIPYSGEYVVVVDTDKYTELKVRKLLDPPMVSRVIKVFDADRYYTDLKITLSIDSNLVYYSYHIVFKSEGDMFIWKLTNL